jgi:hypothetical protein
LVDRDSEQIVGRERRERVSHSDWSGDGFVNSRRRVNSAVGPQIMRLDATQAKKAADLKELYHVLRREIEFLGKALPCNDDEPTAFPDPTTLTVMERRVLVRSIFSFIEALVYGLKMLALDDANTDMILSRGERMIAEEEDYQLDESGSVVTRPSRLRFLSNLRFAFRVLAKVSDAEFNLDVSGAGWQSLQRALKVRDRLMHPKRLADLEVTDAEVREALRAFIWFENQITLVLIQVVRSLQKQHDKLLLAAQQIVGRERR